MPTIKTVLFAAFTLTDAASVLAPAEGVDEMANCLTSAICNYYNSGAKCSGCSNYCDKEGDCAYDGSGRACTYPAEFCMCTESCAAPSPPPSPPPLPFKLIPPPTNYCIMAQMADIDTLGDCQAAALALKIGGSVKDIGCSRDVPKGCINPKESPSEIHFNSCGSIGPSAIVSRICKAA